MDIKTYIRDVDDFPKKGIIFRDITPLLQCPKAYKYVIEQFSDIAFNSDIIAGIESRGFLLASAVAFHVCNPLVILRKPGKLPYKTYKATYDLEYGSAELHVHQDIPKGRVCLIDDVLATGGTAFAAASVLKEAGCDIAACCFLMELDFLHGRDILKDYTIHSMVRYG